MFNMATSNLNKIIIYNTTKPPVATAIKKALIDQFYRQCHIYIFILSVSCNNENKLMATLQFLLAKGTFN